MSRRSRYWVVFQSSDPAGVKERREMFDEEDGALGFLISGESHGRFRDPKVIDPDGGVLEGEALANAITARKQELAAS